MHLHRGRLTVGPRCLLDPIPPRCCLVATPGRCASGSAWHAHSYACYRRVTCDDDAVPTPPHLAAKPCLRGVSHQWGALVFGGPRDLVLVVEDAAVGSGRRSSSTSSASRPCSTTSALYHRVPWGEVGNSRMQQADHTGIFLAIAGTYTPIAVIALRRVGPGGAPRSRSGCSPPPGMRHRVAAVQATPRGYVTAVYLTMGWIAVLALPADLGRDRR